MSSADLAIGEERSGFSTIDANLSGAELVSTVLIPHASALSTRASILESNKKQLSPRTASKAPSIRDIGRAREPRRDFDDRIGGET